MATVLALALLCAGAPGALSAVPIADVSPAPEAEGALALLAAFLPASKAGVVVVVGRVRWADAFLRGLPRETPRAMLTSLSSLTEAGRLSAEVQLTRNILIVVADGPDELIAAIDNAKLIFQRVLFWATGARPASELLRNTTFVHRASRHIHCDIQASLVLSAEDGTAVRYAHKCMVTTPFLEEDRWSTVDHRWLRGAAVFSQFCDQWQPPPSSREPFTLVAMARQVHSQASTIADFIELHGNLPRKIKRVNILIPNRPNDEYYRMWNLTLSQSRLCRWDAVLFHYRILTVSDIEVVHNYLSEKIDVVVLVPAGLGPAVNPLDAVLVEFSPAVWMSTALAALSTAAALACTLRRDRGAALLLALAPLLAQAPGTPPPAGRALRPLLGVWLLVCVVLVAAYQGLLLGKLSTAQPHGEINSLQDLEASGLPVYAQWATFQRVSDILSDNLRNQLKVNHNVDVRKLISKDVVRDRKAAIIMFLDHSARRLLQTWLVPTKMLHYFPIDHLNVIVMGMWTRGSPLGPVVTKVSRRAEQAGLHIHHHARKDAKERLARERRLRALRPAHPLTLRQMLPAYVFLIAGLVLAGAAFVGEVVNNSCVGRGRRS
ncbi:Ionotropic receptor 145 [Frankliniella occidentalis]|nr:Ionotropic receptor 145 [Frankliniella occidentalis]